MARVAITAPPPMTAISQIGSATFSPMYDLLSPLSVFDCWDGEGVVLGSSVTVMTVKGFRVVSVDGLVLFGVI